MTGDEAMMLTYGEWLAVVYAVPDSRREGCDATSATCTSGWPDSKADWRATERRRAAIDRLAAAAAAGDRAAARRALAAANATLDDMVAPTWWPPTRHTP